MANKENLSPYATTWGTPAHDRSRSPANTTFGIRNQKQVPLFGTSPSKNPVLRQQRDHSACRKTDSPLKVRKTRENLREPDLLINIAPPCMHGAHTAVNASNDIGSDQLDTSGSTLVDTHDDAFPVLGPLEPTPAKMQRHKSVSRRMLSKVKEGISQRSRSAQSMRAQQATDGGLMRKLSGRLKQSSEEQPRMRSFEISRASIDSPDDEDSAHVDPLTSHRSFTDSSISMDDALGSTSVTSPAQSSPMTPKTHARQYSGRFLSPSPTSYPSPGDPTPRATSKPMASASGRESANMQVTIPFVDLSVTVDRNFIDVDTSGDVWIAVEGTVRTRVAQASNMQSAQTMPLRKKSIDAIIIVTQDVLRCDRKTAHKCIVELCSRFNIAGDRLAVLCARLQQTGTSAVHFECEQLHLLQSPSLTRLFERLGIAPSATIFEEDWQSLPDSLQHLTDTGLCKDRVQAFIVSRTPDLLIQIIDNLVQWPAHSFKLGLAAERATAPTTRTRHNWAVQITGDADNNVEIYDNMMKDLRHGRPMGIISSLRLCYKPKQGCRILEVLGQKALKDLRLGQRCSLFLKVQVPRIDISRPNALDEATETDSLFAELESMVGTLETMLVNVEARYRHSMLPCESVVTMRQACSIRRPKSESRWSTVGREGDASKPELVHIALAQFLTMQYPPARALRMINRWVTQDSGSRFDALQQIRKDLQLQINSSNGLNAGSTSTLHDSEKPSVVITDIDSEPYITMSSTSETAETSIRIPSTSTSAESQSQTESGSLSPTSSTAAARTISAAKTTTAITIADTSLADQSLDEGEDSARQLWRHIRHHSLSAKQLAEMTPTKLQQLEDCDDRIKALRHKALTNKRSVGAETLKAWKWEEKTNGGGGEAPWL